MSLERLLISPERAGFINSVGVLVDTFDAEQLAQWYVPLNAHSWPEDCPLEPLEEDPQWAALIFLNAIEKKVDANYLTLHWRAAGNAPDKMVHLARLALTVPMPKPHTFIRKDYRPQGAL